MQLINSLKDTTENFFYDLKKMKFILPELYQNISESWNMKCRFSFGIIYGNSVFFEENGKLEWKKEIEVINYRAEEIETVVREVYMLNKQDIIFSNILRVSIDEEQKKYSVFYYVVVEDGKEVNIQYLKIANKVYHEWIYSCYIIEGWSADNEKYDNIMKKWIIKTESSFYQKLKNIFGIDLYTINGIAGHYYESRACNCTICFLLFKDFEKYDIKFDEPILFAAINIRLIRKMLQMVQMGQYLVVQKNARNKEWEIIGIANGEKLKKIKTKIVFRIKSHMNWVMEFDEENAIAYRCGRYKLENVYFKEKEFRDLYERVFGIKCEEDVENIAKAAFEQEGGSAIIFIESDENGDVVLGEEIKNYRDAVGFRFEKGKKVTGEILESLASIDGTVLFNQTGECLKYGMILNTSQQKGGKRERGSRYNSVWNYIENCKREKIKAIGVVVSEDKTIDILSSI